MKENSRIRFNPVAQEIEVEGSESFVKTYFDKLQGMISVFSKSAAPKKEKSGKVKGARKNVGKATEKIPGKKRVTHIEAVIALIQERAEGITTAAIKEKTGLAESQIWNIVNRATKEGRIKKIKRGIYGPA